MKMKTETRSEKALRVARKRFNQDARRMMAHAYGFRFSQGVATPDEVKAMAALYRRARTTYFEVKCAERDLASERRAATRKGAGR